MINKNSISHNFVAIDVEYADREQNICQIGLAVVRNLQVVDRRQWLIQPPGNYYEEAQMRVHHITPEMTADAGTFDQVWQEIQPVIIQEDLWAHNAASVEQPVLEKNIRNCGYDAAWLDVHDSMSLYQRPDCNGGNGLEQCCMALGIPFDHSNHHDACYDAEICAELVIAYAQNWMPVWDGIPKSSEQLRKSRQDKRVLRLGDFLEYYNSSSSGEEDVFCELTSTCEGAQPQTVDVFDKGDKMPGESAGHVDFSRLNTGENNPLFGKKVVLTGVFRLNRKELEEALERMGARKVPKPTKVTDAVILGTRNVGFTKLCAIEEQEQNGHHVARIVGDDDLEALLYGDGHKFF